MKCVIVKLSTMRREGWHPGTYLAGVSHEDAIIERAQESIRQAQARINAATRRKQEILAKHAMLLANGEIKEV